MKLPLEWLKEVIDVPWNAEGLADRLINLGIGVETVEQNILTLEIPANRGDLLSVSGIAREIHAATGAPIRLPAVSSLPTKKPPLDLVIEKNIVPRYTTAVISGVIIKPTKNPRILSRLKAGGMRPVNNVVDLSNYLMLLTGQPTHAFDLDKIHGAAMTVRLSREGEKLTTLDGVNRTLPKDILVIADRDRLIDLPGVMGGLNSAIDADTKNVVIQAASFPYQLIRKASKAIKLASEASYRFERQVDPGGSFSVLGQFADMIIKEASGSVEGAIDLNWVKPLASISFDPSLYTRLIGHPLPASEMKMILARLGCRVNEKKDSMVVTPPTWRPDITLPEDLVEEIARIRGYAKIAGRLLTKKMVKTSADYLARESLKDQLAARGLSEVATYSFVSARDLSVSGVDRGDAVVIQNPLSDQLKFFRPSLLPGLLRVAGTNPTQDPIRIFEIGRVAVEGKEYVDVGLLFAGKNADEIGDLARNLGLTVSQVSEKVRHLYKIRKQEVYIALGPFDEVVKNVKPSKLTMPVRFTVKPMSKYPTVVRDISFVVDALVGNDEIRTAISEVSPRIYLTELFDEFVSPKIGMGKKSLAFHIHYQNPQKTMTAEEIEKLHGKVEAMLKSKYDAKVR